MTSTKTILCVGCGAEPRAEITAEGDGLVDVVNSLDEAADVLASKEYDRVIVDPDVLRNYHSQAETLSLIRELAESEENLRTLALFPEENPYPVMRITREGRILYANESCTAFGDHSPCRVGEVVSADMRQMVLEAMDSGQNVETDIDSYGRTFTVSFVPVAQAGYVNLYGLDITRRKRAEHDLVAARADAQRQAAEMQAFISSMADGVILWDADGNVILRNEASKEMMGEDTSRTLKEMLRKHPQLTMDGEPVSPKESATARALRGEKVKRTRFRTRIDENREAVLSVSAAPVKDSAGHVIGATTVLRDITQQVARDKERDDLYQREHRISRILQSALVPPMTSLNIEDCQVTMRYEAALREAEVGGDFYDVFELIDGRIGIVIGDVAGKGLNAAVHVAAAKHALRSYAFLYPSPGKAMSLANEVLCRGETAVGLESSMLTAFMAIVDTRAGVMTYANAGHEPPLVRDSKGNIEELSESCNLALGVMCSVDYVEVVRKIEAGDTIIMVTDGITEARPSGALLFGRDGIVKYLEDNRQAGVDDIPPGLLEAARTHAGGTLQDDAAIVAFRCAVK